MRMCGISMTGRLEALEAYSGSDSAGSIMKDTASWFLCEKQKI